MVSSSTTQNKLNQNKLVTDIWVKATWEEFIGFAGDNNEKFDEKAKFYYHDGYMRSEMSPIGPLHARHNSIISSVIKLFATLKNIRIVELNNASFRRSGTSELQPDLSYYIGLDFKLPPRSNTPINLNEFPPPTLVVEIGATSINDDLGMKRLLYEQSGSEEYWVVDANLDRVIAFSIADGRSGQIDESEVLKGLKIELVEEALKKSQTEEDGEINRWLLNIFGR